MKRLLFIVNVAWFFVSHRLPIARAALRQDFEVHLATTITRESERAEIEAAGIQVHSLPFDRSGYALLTEWRTLRSIGRLFRELQPDIVHLVSAKPVLYGGLMARKCRVPAVVSAITGLGHVYLKPGFGGIVQRSLLMGLYRSALRHPNSRVLFQNSHNMELFLASRAVSEEQSVLIRGSGVNLDRFVVCPEPSGAPRVTLASRMIREKGVFEFVEAAQILRSKGVAARLTLVGASDAGNPGSIDEKQLKEWNAAGVIEWLGHRSDMPEVFAQSNIVCLPTYGEGLPKVLLEAAACGRAIVTTDVPGCRDIGRRNQNALLVPPRNPQALASAIEELVVDSALRARFAVAGRQLVEREFSERHILEQTLAVYEDLARHQKLHQNRNSHASLEG